VATPKRRIGGLRQRNRSAGAFRGVDIRNGYGLELLEKRILMSQVAQAVAAGVFAQLSGQVPAGGGSSQLIIALNASDVTLPTGSTGAVLAFQAISGGTLDPAAVQITNSSGQPVNRIYSAPDLVNNTQSLALARLPYGTYTLSLSGDRGTSGLFSLDLRLIGDLNGDGQTVNSSDYFLFKSAFGSVAGDSRYNPAADSISTAGSTAPTTSSSSRTSVFICTRHRWRRRSLYLRQMMPAARVAPFTKGHPRRQHHASRHHLTDIAKPLKRLPEPTVRLRCTAWCSVQATTQLPSPPPTALATSPPQAHSTSRALRSPVAGRWSSTGTRPS
jgi:hypothetical protein